MADDIAQNISTAIENGHWAIFAGLAIMILIGIARQFFSSFPTKYIPLVSAIIGVFSTVGTALASGASIIHAIVSGIVTGSAAGGLWSLIGKHLMNYKVKEEDA